MKKSLIIASICVLFAGTAAWAYPTQVSYIDGPQDPLVIPPEVHELGTAPAFSPFPDELIEADAGQIDLVVCLDPTTPDDPLLINAVVRMTNLTGIDWAEVWYVADFDETTHSNYDGWVVGAAGTPTATAFRIDRKANDPLGIHHPLIGESMTPDGIFEAGELWQFVIQDYINALGKPASALGSIGVPSVPFVTPPDPSSGSIIAVPVPEPVTMILLGLGASALIRKRRRA